MQTNKMKSITVNVTQEVIAAATQKDSSQCMIAQALRLRGAKSTHVTAESVRFNMDGMRYHYPLPARAALKLLSFDKGAKVSPFTFQLSANTGTCAPCEVKGPLNRAKGKAKPKKTDKTKEVVKRCKRRFHGLRAIEVKATRN